MASRGPAGNMPTRGMIDCVFIGPDYRRSILGSRASRKASPSRMNASTVQKMARLGNRATWGAFHMSAPASLSMPPQSDVDGCEPMPRNDRLAAVMMDVPTRMVKYTTMDEMVPGRMWRIRMVQSEAPMLLVASM